MARQATIKGLANLQRKLDRLPAAAKEHIRAEMERAAEEIVATMRRLAPVLKEPDARRRAGALRDSIGWTWGKAPKGSMVVAALKGAGVGGDLTITIYAGGGEDDAFYARFVEFGTKRMQAQPFFYVSWRAHRRGRNNVRTRMNRAVRESARQVARSK